jgi:hypothetical protein
MGAGVACRCNIHSRFAAAWVCWMEDDAGLAQVDLAMLVVMCTAPKYDQLLVIVRVEFANTFACLAHSS